MQNQYFCNALKIKKIADYSSSNRRVLALNSKLTPENPFNSESINIASLWKLVKISKLPRSEHWCVWTHSAISLSELLSPASLTCDCKSNLIALSLSNPIKVGFNSFFYSAFNWQIVIRFSHSNWEIIFTSCQCIGLIMSIAVILAVP